MSERKERDVTRVDFSECAILEAERQARIVYLSAVLAPFKSSKKRGVKNLKQLRAEATALDNSWTACYELNAAHARLKLAQEDYNRAYDLAVARVDSYLGVRLERFTNLPKTVGHS